jgi:hypothetical protein
MRWRRSGFCGLLMLTVAYHSRQAEFSGTRWWRPSCTRSRCPGPNAKHTEKGRIVVSVSINERRSSHLPKNQREDTGKREFLGNSGQAEATHSASQKKASAACGETHYIAAGLSPGTLQFLTFRRSPRTGRFRVWHTLLQVGPPDSQKHRPTRVFCAIASDGENSSQKDRNRIPIGFANMVISKNVVSVRVPVARRTSRDA